MTKKAEAKKGQAKAPTGVEKQTTGAVDVATDVEMWPLAKVKPYKRNAKNHPPEQIEALSKLIAAHGFDQPIVVDKKGVIVKGHGRLLAAQRLNMSEVPVIVRDLPPSVAAAARLGDNRLAEYGWDFAALTGDVVAHLSDPSFKLELIGFTLRDLGLESTATQSPSQANAAHDSDGSNEEKQQSEGTGEINLGVGAHTCPRCNFNFD